MTVLASTVFSGSPSGTDVGLVQVADLTASANVLGNTTFGIDASAGAVRATLPPATGSGDRIVITADDATNTVEIASGDSLNGEALGSIFPVANDVVYLIDAKVGDWTGRVLQAPTVTPVDEFNSNAVVTSTVGTLSFAGGDIVITDPNNAETWFAGPSADSSSIGGAASQTAILLDNNYTTLNMAVDPALQGEDVIYWWDNLAAGDTVNGLGLTVSEVIGAGTLTGNAATADGTGLMGMRISDADGAALILTSTVTTTGAIHLFAEIPIEVPAAGLDLGRATTTERDALTALTGGEHLYNTTTETRQWYHPGSGGQTVAYDSTGGPVGGSGINAESTERGQTVPYAAFPSQFQTIDLGLASTTATSDAQVTVYDGVGLGGTVLGQQTVTVPISAAGIGQYVTVNFPSPVLIPSGAGNFTIGVVRVAGTGGTQFWLSDDYLPGGGNLTLSNALDHSMVLTLTDQGATPPEWRDYPASSPSTALLASARVMAFSGSGQSPLETVTSVTTHANDAENLMLTTARVGLTPATWANLTFDRSATNGVTVSDREFTIVNPGRYRINAEASIDGASSRAVQIVRNGTEILAIATGYSDAGSHADREVEITETLAAGDTIDIRIASQGTATPAYSTLNISVDQVATEATVPTASVTPVDIGHHRFVASADNANGFSGSTNPVTFDSHVAALDVGGIATFDGTNIVVTAGANPVELKALIHTDGSGSHSGNLYFRDAADVIGLKFGDGVVANGVSSRGFYGEGSQNTPPTAAVAAGTTVTLQVVHSSSAASQLVQAGSYIDVREIVGQQTVVPAGSVTPVDVETVEFAKQTGLTFATGYTLDSGRTWQDLKNDYEYLRVNFDVDVTAVTDNVLRTITIKTADIVPASHWRFEYGAALVDIEPGALNTGNFDFGGSTVDGIGMEIVGVKAQQQILPPGSIVPTVPQSDVTYLASSTAVSLAGPAAMAGLSVTLPEAGTYQIVSTLEAVFAGDPPSECIIQALLHDGSAYLRDGVPLSIGTMAPTGISHNSQSSASIILDYVATGPTTIEVHTLASDPGSMLTINLNGGSSIAYRRLGDQIIT